MDAVGPLTLAAIILPVLLTGLGVWLLLRAARRVSVRDDTLSGFILLLARTYARWVHRLKVIDGHNIPQNRAPGPLIVVSNHTAGVDPVLIQSAVPFEVRWVMAADMRVRLLDPFWRWMGIIFVDRRTGRAVAMREALRHLEQGGVLGLFPEGAMERPPRVLKRFRPGLAMLLEKTGADVLPVIIDGAPCTPSAWTSIFRRSHATVRVLPRLSPVGEGIAPKEFAEELEKRYRTWTGWPMATDPDGQNHSSLSSS